MAKLLKIIGRTISRIIGITLEWVMLVIILFAFFIRTSSFQTYLGEAATSYLSSELNTELHIGKIEIIFIDKLLLKDVYVQDLKKDTLVSVGTIEVKLQTLNLTANKVVISSVLIDDGRIGINRDKKTGDYNYQFIADYFSSDSPKTSKSEPMAVLVKEISLNKIDLSYEDFRKEHMPYGLDYDYLHFRNVNLTINRFASKDGVIGFNIARFTAVEQSGLNLQLLKLRATIDPKQGILLKNITIQTPTTAIYASHFNLKVKSFDDFDKFNSKVVFDASIDSSKIDLKDVSYFVPALEGMDQQIALSAALSKPLNQLTISDLDLRFGARSVVRGDFVLPDFSLEDQAKLNQELQYCFVDFDDLKALHLPKSAGMKSIKLQPMIDQLNFVELREVKVNGQMKQFVMSSDKIGTGLGNVKLNNGIQFTSLKEGGYAFTKTANSNFDVYIDSFQLGKFIDQDILGSVTGSAFLTGVVGQKDVIRITELSGDFQKFGFNQYTYSNIKVYDGSFIDNVFKSKIDIDDPHLAMKFDGFIDVNKKQKFDFDLNVTKADLGALNFDGDPNSSLVANLDINLNGTGIDDYSGNVTVEELAYKENGKTITLPKLDLTLLRDVTEDHLILSSEVADIDMKGKISSGNIVAALNNSFAELLPTIISPMKIARTNSKREFFNGTITLKNTEQIFALYYPELHIAPETKIDLSYDSQTDVQEMTITSNEIALIPLARDTSKVQKQFVSNLKVVEKLANGNMNTTVNADRASYNDSLYVDSFSVAINGSKGDFDTKILWNPGEADPASFEVETQLLPNNEIAGVVKPSFFSVKGERWDIKQQSKFDVNIANQKIVVDKLLLERETQSIRLDGTLSNDENDVVNLDLKDVHVEEFSKIFAPGTDIVGRLDGHASLKTPFTQARANGNISLTQFYMNKTEIGDLILEDVVWNPVKELLSLNGKLEYLNQESVVISGQIYPFREKDNYKVGIKFKNTDLKFTNAFIDPEVVSNIKGTLNGTLNVTGLLDAPDISGKIDLVDAGAKIGILGTTYSMSGKVTFDGKNDFISAILPVYDNERNVAIADLQISHQAFKNFDINLDFWFDEETVSGVYRKPYTGKFMVLNTVEKEGDIYYGKAYASGYANLAIHESLTEIEVHAKTERGTVINLPLYGASDVSEFDFIEFEDPNGGKNNQANKDSGLDLSLFLNVTNEAEVNLIFNPKTGDAIKAYGEAKPLEILIKRDGSISMVGTYEFSKSPAGKRGGYDFNLPPIKERFDIEEGGTVQWSGTPYDSKLDVTALKTVVADMNTLADDGSTNGNERKRKVECIMQVGGYLSKPTFDVGLKLLDGNENDRALLNRATTTPDDTQKQWFKLLATHSFAPLNGGGGGGAGGAGMDLAGQYLDQLLKGVGGENVGFQASGGNSVLTFQKSLGKNVIVRGSGGVAVDNTGQTGGNTSSLMGDMSIDVLLNDDGTFKMTIFNEPNGNNALASKENGDYTQGVGLSYSEEFNQTKDSRLLKALKDPFNNKGTRKKRNKNKVPASSVVPIVVDPKPEKEEPKQDPTPPNPSGPPPPASEEETPQ